MPSGRRTRRKLLFSKIYAFQCCRAAFKQDHSQIGGLGFSRVVYCNEPDCSEAGISHYASNYVQSTKYTLATFLPKSLFEQFRRVANFYFLVTGIEDWQRKQQDIEVNNRKVGVHNGRGVFEPTEWKNLRVGDIVKVEKDEFFPADLVLLSSSYDDAICYVETMNLDGETNLKLKKSLEVTSNLQGDGDFGNFKAIV
ncbi:hypothetical protein SAY87_015833 [Trapa incisa]|uniref:P-type ATPase N-terminal domain-containing protein n=1 Tax=Trapa incisa TaxID=236973 RepID=A0AAN7L4Z2_9MYRT|nr:hypothetical protein SAY87_015833 [Trapa incisa]